MANRQHVAVIRCGVEKWNEWRREFPNVDPDLSDADLRLPNGDGYDDANLRRANLSGANLAGASLRGADLSDANLFGAWLVGATLRESSLYVADLSEADCQDADISGADIRRAYFIRTNLAGAKLSKARVRATTFVNLDLSPTDGLSTLTHEGPSGVGIDTIFKFERKDTGSLFARVWRAGGVHQNCAVDWGESW